MLSPGPRQGTTLTTTLSRRAQALVAAHRRHRAAGDEPRAIEALMAAQALADEVVAAIRATKAGRAA